MMSLGSESLMETSELILDLSVSGWRVATGTPRSYVKTPTNKIILYPMPIVADTINMTVSRFPNTLMTLTGSPEVDSRYHQGLILWMLHRAFSKNDSETLNTDKAADYEKQFDKFFGPKKRLSD